MRKEQIQKKLDMTMKMLELLYGQEAVDNIERAVLIEETNEVLECRDKKKYERMRKSYAEDRCN